MSRPATSVQAPARGADDAAVVSSQRPSDRADDEDGAAAQVQAGEIDAGSPIRRRSPVGLLVEGVDPDEQEQRRELNRDEVPQLVVARSGPCWR